MTSIILTSQERHYLQFTYYFIDYIEQLQSGTNESRNEKVLQVWYIPFIVQKVIFWGFPDFQ